MAHLVFSLEIATPGKFFQQQQLWPPQDCSGLCGPSSVWREAQQTPALPRASQGESTHQRKQISSTWLGSYSTASAFLIKRLLSSRKINLCWSLSNILRLVLFKLWKHWNLSMVLWSFPSETASTWLGLKGTVDSSLKDAQEFYFWLICSLRKDINQQIPAWGKVCL